MQGSDRFADLQKQGFMKRQKRRQGWIVEAERDADGRLAHPDMRICETKIQAETIARTWISTKDVRFIIRREKKGI